jgi:Fibronectin type III domain
MRTVPGPHADGRLSRLVLRVGVVASLAITLSSPGEAIALFSVIPVAPSIGVTAATISAPAGLTATAASSTTASLSWTAPAALTGYTLSQSPGTLAGCSATPSASTTSCTATGLSPSTAYSWTLTAVYNNWQSAPAQVSATTPAGLTGVTLVGKVNDVTPTGQSTTVTGVSTTSGATLLILIYRATGSGNGSPSISSVSGTAISSTAAPSQVNTQAFNPSGVGRAGVFAWLATGTGQASGTVKVTFDSPNNLLTTVDVLQLSGVNTTSPVVRSAVSTGSSATATGGALTGASAGDGEVFFAGLGTLTTMSSPAGYTAVDAPAAGSPAWEGSWFNPSASSAPIKASLGASTVWGTIEIELKP